MKSFLDEMEGAHHNPVLQQELTGLEVMQRFVGQRSGCWLLQAMSAVLIGLRLTSRFISQRNGCWLLQVMSAVFIDLRLMSRFISYRSECWLFQVMSAEGTPLCLHCHQPCSTLLSKETLTNRDAAWHTRFCSRVCADAHWVSRDVS